MYIESTTHVRWVLLGAALWTAGGSAQVRFNRDIRPIMAGTCFPCHGPDKSSRMAGMRLDLRDEALQPNRSGVAPIVPGDPEKSAIVARVFAQDARIMPPALAHKEPMSQGGDGRDHHIKGFSFLVAGGGMKAGLSYGTTDGLGYAAEQNPVSVDDFHATMLHLLGVDHQRLAVKFQGLDVRLTGISGDVVRDIVA